MDTRESEAVPTCTHNLCSEEMQKNIKHFQLKICISTTNKVLFIAWACVCNVDKELIQLKSAKVLVMRT